ncbi:Tim44 domain-containing protein [Mesorhizobium marinum]|uniref:Tim44 domain-containing protein n=1 Tax=Mesorhizobium marinum TaxID=3228790 RepID=UPI003465D453
MQFSRTTRFATLLAGLFLAFSMVAVDHADARRSGSFGSRGAKTFQQAPTTRTAPQPTAPVERSMTPNTGPTAARPGAAQAQSQRPGFMNGFGGSMLRGLMLGGLIGLLLGQGFGGLAGMFGLLMQALLIGGAIWLVLRLLRAQPARSPEPALAGAGAGGGVARRDVGSSDIGRSFKIPSIGGSASAPAPAAQPTHRDIELGQQDLDTFERMLTEVQEAFGREDHKELRRLATPEMVSYLSEELAENAQKDVRNDVSDVRLLQADIAEAWNEGDRDYATAALNYAAIDVLRDRKSGDVVEGEAGTATETTELWTFVRQTGGDWKLSAIQQA